MAKILIGKYEATIYPENGRVTGAVSLGLGPDGKRKRLKRKGRNKTEVIDKLIEAVKDLESGVDGSAHYTVQDAVEDWLSKGLKGRDPDTVTTNRILAEKHVIPLIGKAKLKNLRADDVDKVARRAHGQVVDAEPSRRPLDPETGDPSGSGP